MGSNVFPAPSAGGGIKSVQRGSAGASGNVTITSVDISKSFVNIYGTASSGTVAASGSINAANMTPSGTGNITGNLIRNDGVSFAPFPYAANEHRVIGANQILNFSSMTGNATNLTGGSTNLVAAVVQGFLANSTTLTVSGPCRWEVVEFA
jgi:hypothetical protein